MSWFQTSGGSGRSGNEYDFTLVNGCRHFLYNLSKEGPTEIRVVPALVNGAPEPLINPVYGMTLQDALTSAFAVIDVVRFLGPNKVNLICPPPAEGERLGPVQYFINTMRDTVDNDPKNCPDEWLAWCGKGRGLKDLVSKPQQVVLMQGFLHSHKGRPCVDKEGRTVVRSPVVLMLNRSATNDLLDKLSKPANNNAQWGADNNKLGDPVDLVHGRMLRLSPYPHEFNGLVQTWYMAELGDEIPLTIDEAASVWQPWERVLNYNPSLGEVGNWLTKAFDAASVVRIFENHPVYSACVTESIRRMASSPTTIPAGYGAPPPPYTPPSQLSMTQDYRVGYTPQAQQQPRQQQPYPPQPQYQQPVYPPVPEYTPSAPADEDQMDDAQLPFDGNLPQRDVGISPNVIQRRAPRQ